MSHQPQANPLAHGNAHQQWIQAAWPQLGAIAVRHFMQDGRGFVLLNMIEADILNKDTAAVKCEYVAESSPRFKKCVAILNEDQPEGGADLAKAVSGYNPAREIVLGVCL